MVVLFDERGRVLLVRQNYGRGVWALPGGALEPGESPQHAAAREAREEIGVEVEVDHLVSVYHLPPPRPGIRFVFAARIRSGEPSRVAPDEIAEVAWFDPAALPSPATVGCPFAVADAVAGRRGVFRSLDRAR